MVARSLLLSLFVFKGLASPLTASSAPPSRIGNRDVSTVSGALYDVSGSTFGILDAFLRRDFASVQQALAANLLKTTDQIEYVKRSSNLTLEEADELGTPLTSLGTVVNDTVRIALTRRNSWSNTDRATLANLFSHTESATDALLYDISALIPEKALEKYRARTDPTTKAYRDVARQYDTEKDLSSPTNYKSVDHDLQRISLATIYIFNAYESFSIDRIIEDFDNATPDIEEGVKSVKKSSQLTLEEADSLEEDLLELNDTVSELSELVVENKQHWTDEEREALSDQFRQLEEFYVDLYNAISKVIPSAAQKTFRERTDPTTKALTDGKTALDPASSSSMVAKQTFENAQTALQTQVAGDL